jgi:hypothetical protein
VYDVFSSPVLVEVLGQAIQVLDEFKEFKVINRAVCIGLGDFLDNWLHRA